MRVGNRVGAGSYETAHPLPDPYVRRELTLALALFTATPSSLVAQAAKQRAKPTQPASASGRWVTKKSVSKVGGHPALGPPGQSIMSDDPFTGHAQDRLRHALGAYGLRPVWCRVQLPPLGLLPVLRTKRMPVSDDGSYPHAAGP